MRDRQLWRLSMRARRGRRAWKSYAFYAWYQARMDELYDEWQQCKKARLRGEYDV